MAKRNYVMMIYCDETHRTYKSAQEASEDTGVSANTILKQIEYYRNHPEKNKVSRRKDKTVYHFKQLGDRHLQNFGKAVKCLDTGEIFPSMAEASRAIGMGESAVSNSIRRGHLVNGLKFVFVPTYEL